MPSTILWPKRSIPMATIMCSPSKIVPSMIDNRKLDIGQRSLHQLIEFAPACLNEMVARRALLESISIGKLLDDFFVTAHREAVHDLVPHGFFDQRSALEYLVAAQRNLFVVLLVADSWPVRSARAGHQRYRIPPQSPIGRRPASDCAWTAGRQSAQLRPPSPFR